MRPKFGFSHPRFHCLPGNTKISMNGMTTKIHHPLRTQGEDSFGFSIINSLIQSNGKVFCRHQKASRKFVSVLFDPIVFRCRNSVNESDPLFYAIKIHCAVNILMKKQVAQFMCGRKPQSVLL